MSKVASGSRESLSSPLSAQKSYVPSMYHSDESDDDDESLPDYKNGSSHTKGFDAFVATPPRSFRAGASKEMDYKNGSPKKRTAEQLSAEMADLSRRANANPVRGVVKKNLERSMGSKSSSEGSEEEVSSSSEEEDSGDEYGKASPKKKQKTKAKAAAVAKGRTGKKSSASTSSSVTDALIAKAKLESAFNYGEDEMIKQSQEESRARLADIDKRLAITSGSQISSSSADSVPREAKKLTTCPFCYEDMPQRMSIKLKETMQYWLDQYHQKRRIGSTATLEACQQHRDEKDTIPEGRMKGFKMRLNPEKLRLRIRSEKLPFVGHLRGRIEDPESSEWFCNAVDQRREIGRRADTTFAQMHTLEVMQAGYFGELGWEAMRDALLELFVDEVTDEKYDLERIYAEEPKKIGGLRPQKFIELVLLPELILLLIIDDFKGRNNTSMSLEEAREVRNDSTPYGLAKFPSKAMGNVTQGRNVFGDKMEEPKAPPKDDEKMGESSIQKKTKKVGSTREDAISVGESPKKQRKNHTAARMDEKGIETPPLTQQSDSSSRPRPRPRPAARGSKPGDSFCIEILSGSTVPSSLPFASSQDRLGTAQGDPIILPPDPTYPLEDEQDNGGLSQSFSSPSLPSQITLQRSPSLAMTPENRKIRQRTTSGRIDGY